MESSDPLALLKALAPMQVLLGAGIAHGACPPPAPLALAPHGRRPPAAHSAHCAAQLALEPRRKGGSGGGASGREGETGEKREGRAEGKGEGKAEGKAEGIKGDVGAEREGFWGRELEQESEKFGYLGGDYYVGMDTTHELPSLSSPVAISGLRD
ncbi:unnamed protein product [Closterium sp. NIES-64]|nr:unnamed protein product [Closterium sp. NIES-64]